MGSKYCRSVAEVVVVVVVVVVIVVFCRSQTRFPHVLRVVIERLVMKRQQTKAQSKACIARRSGYGQNGSGHGSEQSHIVPPRAVSPFLARTSLVPDAGTMPTETPIWIALDAASQQLLDLKAFGLGLRCDGHRSSGLYGNTTTLLQMLADGSAIEEHDDTNHDLFPQIAGQLKVMSPLWEAECFCVMICRERRVWGVGVATRSRNRLDAARVALAGALAMDRIARGEPAPSLWGYEAFASFSDRAMEDMTVVI